jgi:hypothetical protein
MIELVYSFIFSKLFITMAKSPFCSFRAFFRERVGLLLNWRKFGLKASDSSPVLTQKGFESLIRKKSECHFTKGPFCH